MKSWASTGSSTECTIIYVKTFIKINMAKSFASLKDPKLGLLDILPIGKFKGCRVCDVIDDDWEYLKWMHSNTSVRFQKPVLDKITYLFTLDNAEVYYAQEVDPYLNDPLFEDVPY